MHPNNLIVSKYFVISAITKIIWRYPFILAFFQLGIKLVQVLFDAVR